MDGDAVFDVLDAVCILTIRAFRGKFVSANGALVFFGDLAARRRRGLGGWYRSGWKAAL